LSRQKTKRDNTLGAEQLVYEKKSGKRIMAGNSKGCLFHKNLILKKVVYHHKQNTSTV